MVYVWSVIVDALTVVEVAALSTLCDRGLAVDGLKVGLPL
jgi:hypothetical protein